MPARRSAVLTAFRGATAINDGTTAEPRRSWRCHCCLCRTSTVVAPRLLCVGLHLTTPFNANWNCLQGYFVSFLPCLFFLYLNATSHSNILTTVVHKRNISLKRKVQHFRFSKILKSHNDTFLDKISKIGYSLTQSERRRT